MALQRTFLAVVFFACVSHDVALAQASGVQMTWGPSPVATGHATRLVWQWSGGTLPEKGILSNGSGGQCPKAFVDELANQPVFPARFGMGWIPDAPGTYACTLSFVMPNGSPSVSPSTASINVTQAK